MCTPSILNTTYICNLIYKSFMYTTALYVDSLDVRHEALQFLSEVIRLLHFLTVFTSPLSSHVGGSRKGSGNDMAKGTN